MRFTTLAVDYDGTIAWDGRVDGQTISALQRLRESGRQLILVTGRQLPHVIDLFPQFHLFERIVAENGAVLYAPGSGIEQLLADPPPDQLVETLRYRGVHPWQPDG